MQEQAKNGMPTLRVKRNNAFAFLHSAYDPQAEAEHFASRLTVKPDGIFVCFGLGFGYHIQAISKRFGPKNKLLIIEPSEDIFRQAIQSGLLDQWRGDQSESNRLCMVVAADAVTITDFLQGNYGQLDLQKIQPVIWPAYEKLFPEESRTFLKAIKESIVAKQVDAVTTLALGALWRKNILYNIPDILDSYRIESFYQFLKGKPVIIVAGGPSLNKNIRQLREAKGKIIILCVYTAYQVLRTYDIQPDFIISVDARQLEKESLEERRRPIHIPLLHSGIVMPELLAKHRGHKISFCDGIDGFLPYLLSKSDVPFRQFDVGGSVACAALSVADYLGAGSIIFIGLDLAMVDGQSHAKGTAHDAQDYNSESIHKDRLMVEGQNGEQLYTIHTLLSFKTWIERFIRNHEHIHFIDATEGGAFIKGTEICTLSHAIAREGANAPNTAIILNDAFRNGRKLNKEQKQHCRATVRETLLKTETLESTLETVSQMFRDVRQWIQNDQKQQQLKAIRKALSWADKADGQISENKAIIFLLNYAFAKIAIDLQSLQDDNQLVMDEKIAGQAALLYDGLLRILREALPELRELDHRLNLLEVSYDES